MSNDKKNPTKIDLECVATPTEDLEKSIAEDLEAEDPTESEKIIAALEIQPNTCEADCGCSEEGEPENLNPESSSPDASTS